MRVLFQGDSITDCGRDRKNIRNLGHGYPRFAAQMLEEKFPDVEWEFLNTAIGGNLSRDLRARWETDCLELKPDILSVLIGINDVGHYFRTGELTAPEAYEENCRYLFENAKASGAKLLVLEPFLLMSQPDRAQWLPDLSAKIARLRRLARELADVYIPLDGLFAAECVKKPPIYWAVDGVHPTDEGAWLIARHYSNTFKCLMEY